MGARDVYAADMDGDGDIDIISASRNDHKICWFEGSNPVVTFSVRAGLTLPAPFQGRVRRLSREIFRLTIGASRPYN